MHHLVLTTDSHGRSVEGSQVEAELQDGEGDIQTTWLNIKRLPQSFRHPLHYSAARGLKAGDARATCKAPGTCHLQKRHSQEAGASVHCLQLHT